MAGKGSGFRGSHLYIYESSRQAVVGEEHVTEKPGEAGGKGGLAGQQDDLLTRYMTSHSMALGVRRRRWVTKWQLQDAKARFSELIDDTLEKGPQIVTRRGIDTAVVVSFEEWRRLRETARPNLKDVLLGPGPRFDIPLPARGRIKSRPPMKFDD